MTTNGAFSSLYSFTGGRDGANSPYTGLLQGSDGSIYGTTSGGGQGGAGTVFRLTIVPGLPQLALISSGPNLILSWPTNASDFVIQFATTLANGGDWQDSTAIPTQTNGQNVVTMLTSGSAGFFRLCGP